MFPLGRQERYLDHIQSLDKRLRTWHEEIPLELRDGEIQGGGYDSIEESDEDIGGFGPKFTQYLLQLQALALRFAYENTMIMIHRPLLSLQLRTTSDTPRLTLRILEGCPAAVTQFESSMRAFHDAAIQTSRLGSLSSFPFAVQSYAAAFMSAHIFTAGVALSLSASVEPLSERARMSKTGLQRLIHSHKILPRRARAVSDVNLILEQLTRLVLDKELARITHPTATDLVDARHGRSTINDPEALYALDDGPGHIPHASTAAAPSAPATDPRARPTSGARPEITSAHLAAVEDAFDIDGNSFLDALYDFEQGTNH